MLARCAGHHIGPSVGGLVGVLKKAINDSNRNVAAAVIRLCASLCSSIGERFASVGRPLVGPIVKAASDMKPAVQSAVAEFATAYVMQVCSACLCGNANCLHILCWAGAAFLGPNPITLLNFFSRGVDSGSEAKSLPF